MSAELVPINNEIIESSDRRAALERLNIAAENAATPEEARAIMVQAAGAADIMKKTGAEFELAWAAGKASVTAARRLGVLLEALSNRTSRLKGKGTKGSGTQPSERGRVMRQLGITLGVSSHVRRLARVDNAEFQRYIQDKRRIPSVFGALSACSGGQGLIKPQAYNTHTFRHKRRRRARVKAPAHPSIDAGQNSVRTALGHWDRKVGGSVQRQLAISQAVEHLYKAEDLVRPYTSGYGE